MNYAFLRDPIFSGITGAGDRGGDGAGGRTAGGVDYWEIHDDELKEALRTRWRNVSGKAYADFQNVPVHFVAITRIAVSLANDPAMLRKLSKHMGIWRSHEARRAYKQEKVIPALCRMAHAHLRAHGICLTYKATVAVAEVWESCVWLEIQGLVTQGAAAAKRLHNAPGSIEWQLTNPRLLQWQ